MKLTDKSLKIVAKTIYGEARGEYQSKTGGLPSLIAVANVILNRYISTNDKRLIEDICTKPKQFSCWNKCDPNFRVISGELSASADSIYGICETVAKEVVLGHWPDITKGATNYYSKSMKAPPYWASHGDVTMMIGNHVFIKLR
jgi:spore germination cell wall hydrolase CwlJ-like protein